MGQIGNLTKGTQRAGNTATYNEEGIMIEKERVRPADVLTPREVKIVLAMVQDSTARSALNLMYLCGLSAEQTVRVMVRDVHLLQKVLKVAVHNAASGERVGRIHLSKAAFATLVGLLKENASSRWLFPEGDTHISVESLKVAFDQALVKSRIRKEVSVGSLRNASILFRFSKECYGVLSRQLCHSDVRSLKHYVTAAKDVSWPGVNLDVGASKD